MKQVKTKVAETATELHECCLDTMLADQRSPKLKQLMSTWGGESLKRNMIRAYIMLQEAWKEERNAPLCDELVNIELELCRAVFTEQTLVEIAENIIRILESMPWLNSREAYELKQSKAIKPIFWIIDGPPKPKLWRVCVATEKYIGNEKYHYTAHLASTKEEIDATLRRIYPDFVWQGETGSGFNVSDIEYTPLSDTHLYLD